MGFPTAMVDVHVATRLITSVSPVTRKVMHEIRRCVDSMSVALHPVLESYARSSMAELLAVGGRRAQRVGRQSPSRRESSGALADAWRSGQGALESDRGHVAPKVAAMVF